MMEGIEVLTQINILQTPQWVNIIFFVSTIMAVCGLTTLILGLLTELDFGLGLGCIFIIVGVISMFTCIILDETYKEPTGRYEYQVIIDENVSFTDVYSNYEVVDQNGLIWTIIDKEVGD